MGRLEQAMRRAQQSGAVTGFGTIPGSAQEIAALAAELPDESVRRPASPTRPKADPSTNRFARRMLVLPPPLPYAAPPAPMLAAPKPQLRIQPLATKPAAQQDDDKETREIKELFFNTYHEKVWCGS